MVDRRKVTMVSISAGPPDELGRPAVITHEATDYIDVDHLDEYVADAQTRWQSVVVGDEPDDGPAGADGAYDITAATTTPEV